MQPHPPLGVCDGPARPARLLPARVRLPAGLGRDVLRRAAREYRVERGARHRRAAGFAASQPRSIRTAQPGRPCVHVYI